MMIIICDHCEARTERGDLTTVRLYGQGWEKYYELCPTCTAVVLEKCATPQAESEPAA